MGVAWHIMIFEGGVPCVVEHRSMGVACHVTVMSIDLRKKLRVKFVNSQGLSEPGIDGGGVFREFLSEVLTTGFDPNRGYFSTTPHAQLYPNPQVSLSQQASGLVFSGKGHVRRGAQGRGGEGPQKPLSYIGPGQIIR